MPNLRNQWTGTFCADTLTVEVSNVGEVNVFTEDEVNAMRDAVESGETVQVHHCTNCGNNYTLTAQQIIDRGDAGVNINDRCPRCFDRAFRQCSDCGRWIRTNTQNYYQVETDDCSSGQYVFGNRVIICESCRMSERYQMCVDCSRMFPSEWGAVDENTHRCEMCTPAYLDRTDPTRPQVHDWNYKCEPIFHNLPSDKFVMGTGTRQYFGIELEYNYMDSERTELCRELMTYDDNNLFYAKHDGSLRDGVEVVSHPCTLDYHKQIDYDKLFKRVQELTDNIHEVDADNCGLHLHVNKASLGVTETERELTIAKLLLLFDNLWESYFRRFSRRPHADNLSEYANKNDYLYANGGRLVNQETVNDFELGVAYNSLNKSERYVAVNLCNRNTVEFRFPQTTLDRDVVIANVEMLHHMIAFVKGHSVRKVKNTKDWRVMYLGRQIGSELKTYNKKYFK